MKSRKQKIVELEAKLKEALANDQSHTKRLSDN